MGKKKVLPKVPPIEKAAAAPNAPAEVQQPKQKKRRKKAPLTHKKKSKYPPIPKPKKRGRPKMLVRKSYGGRAPRKIYAGGEKVYGDERYCIRCCERLKEDNLWSSESESEGEDFVTDKVHPWLDPHVCLVCREKDGDTDEEELNGGLLDE